MLYKGTSKCADSTEGRGPSHACWAAGHSLSLCAPAVGLDVLCFLPIGIVLPTAATRLCRAEEVEGPTLQPPPPPLLALQYHHRQARSVGQAAPTAGPNRR